MDNATKQVLKDAVARSARDPAFFCRFFLKSWFPSPLPPFHLGLLALGQRKVEFLNDYPEAHPFLLKHFRYQADPADPTSLELPVFQLNSAGKIIMVCGEHNNEIVPRGFSKTTLANAGNLYEVLTDGTIFAVYISKSSGHAETQLGNIRIQLETNALLRAAYGDVVPTRADVEKWQSDQLQLKNGAILVARGRGGQVRGLNYDGRRPNRILLDDVEDDDTARSPTVRKETESWFYSSVEKAGQVMEGAAGEDWAQQELRITNLGTLLGPDCLMMSLSRDPKFNTIRFGARLASDDPNSTEMLWPYKMSYASYAKERVRHQRVGKLSEFTRELDSAIRVSDDALFPSQFIYSPVLRGQLAQVAIALDPAISDDRKADHAAIMVVGRHESNGLLHILDEWGGIGKTPTELINQFFLMQQKWNCTHAGIEDVAYQKALIFQLREEMARRKVFFHVQGIKQPKSPVKEVRITSILSPRYLNGYIHHLRPFVGLEGNLSDWPNGKKDYADATTMAMTLLGESAGLAMEATFGPPTAADMANYGPQSDPLPPAFQQVSGMIIAGGGKRFNGRYG